jgi:hypothetical protein
MAVVFGECGRECLSAPGNTELYDIFIDISHILYYNIYSYLISKCKKKFTLVPPPRIAQSGPVSPNQGPARRPMRGWLERTFGSFEYLGGGGGGGGLSG